MKLSKKNIIHLCVLTGIYLLFVLALTRFKYAYGSELDWGGQHYAIPDYFRKLFYKTGDFFPSFAPNIGCGENIYNLSYYALCENVHLYTDSIHNRHYSKPVDILYMDASEIHRQHSVCTELCVSLFSTPYLPQSQAHNVRELYAVPAFRFYGYRGLF